MGQWRKELVDKLRDNAYLTQGEWYAALAKWYLKVAAAYHGEHNQDVAWGKVREYDSPDRWWKLVVEASRLAYLMDERNA